MILDCFFSCLHDRATARSGAEIGLLSLRLSVSQGASLGDFLLAPACPIEKVTHWGEIEPFSATLDQDGLAECDQPGKIPLKYSAMAGNWTRATGRTDSELSHWAIMTVHCRLGWSVLPQEGSSGSEWGCEPQTWCQEPSDFPDQSGSVHKVNALSTRKHSFRPCYGRSLLLATSRVAVHISIVWPWMVDRVSNQKNLNMYPSSLGRWL